MTGAIVRPWGEEAPGDAATRFAGRTSLYRAFDADGRLLYIGISMDWAKRWVGHGLTSPALFQLTARLDVAWYETRADAASAEADLIREFKPPYNVAGTREPTERPKYGYARFFDPEPLAPPPADLSREPTMTLVQASAVLKLEVKTIRNLLSEFKHEFQRAYQKHPRGYQLRMLSEADLYQLRTIISRLDTSC